MLLQGDMKSTEQLGAKPQESEGTAEELMEEESDGEDEEELHAGEEDEEEIMRAGKGIHHRKVMLLQGDMKSTEQLGAKPKESEGTAEELMEEENDGEDEEELHAGEEDEEVIMRAGKGIHHRKAMLLQGDMKSTEQLGAKPQESEGTAEELMEEESDGEGIGS